MEQWQFLIQKQGERSWYPLESPKLEILEGRYRVVARSKLANTDVEVRVTHFCSEEAVPKRRVHKRSRRTNPEGLMAVIPFTYLKPGNWELQCSGDLMSDLLGESWLYRVHLQVMAQEKHTEIGQVDKQTIEHSDASTSSLTSADHTHHPEENLVSTASVESALVKPSNGNAGTLITPKQEIIEQSVNPVRLKGKSAEQILQQLLELAVPASEILLEDETVNNVSVAIPELPLLLVLKKETYVAHWGNTLTINGCVQLQERTNLQKVCNGELRIELRSPQGMEILSQVRQTLKDELIPFATTCSIKIPAECNSKLLLGDISLYGTLPRTGELALLANQSFTVTADVTELLTSTVAINSNEADQENYQTNLSTTQTVDTKQPKPSVKLDLELFNIVKTRNTVQSILTNPTVQKPLPPKLRSADKPVVLSSPQLPNLPQNHNKASSSTLVVSESSALIKHLQPESEIIPIARITQNTTFPFLRRLKVLPNNSTENNTHSSQELDLDITEESQLQDAAVVHNDLPQLVSGKNELDQEVSFEDSVAVVMPSSSELLTAQVHNPYSSPLIVKWMHNHGYSSSEPIDVEYEDYDAYIRIQEELSIDTAIEGINIQLSPNLDNDTELSLETSSSLPLPPPPPTSAFRSPTLPPLRYAKTPLVQLAQEIVLDETHTPEEAILVTSNHDFQHQQQTLVSALVVSKNTIDTEVLPTPQLYLPVGELIAGKSMKVRVQLPEIYPGIAVKLWVEDCQMRWLLYGPRVFTDLVPNSTGELEVMVPIQIPLGSLEIRIEAIAIDTVTQYESDKVSILRTVIPEGLETLQLDEILGL